MHDVEGLAHDDVGHRLDAGRAGRGQELRTGPAVRRGEALHGLQHAIERVGAVVAQVGRDREQRAVRVHRVRVVLDHAVGRRAEDARVARQRVPLEVALARGGDPALGLLGEGGHRLHALHMLELPAEAVGLDQALVAVAGALRRLHDDRELVARQAVVARDVGVVEVVARVAAQLRRAFVEVADLQARAQAQARRRRAAPPPRWRPGPSAARSAAPARPTRGPSRSARPARPRRHSASAARPSG